MSADYTAWRITYQSSEQAAQAAYRAAQQHLARCVELEEELAASLREQQQPGLLQGMVIAAAIVAPWEPGYATEILRAAGVHDGAGLDGCAEYDIRKLIESKVRVPGIHAAWQKARREERQQAEEN